MTEKSHTVRLTADYTISLTMLLHLGAGLMYFTYNDPQANTRFDSLEELGLPGTFTTVAPTLSFTDNAAQGGLRDTGPIAYGNTVQIKLKLGESANNKSPITNDKCLLGSVPIFP